MERQEACKKSALQPWFAYEDVQQEKWPVKQQSQRSNYYYPTGKFADYKPGYITLHFLTWPK